MLRKNRIISQIVFFAIFFIGFFFYGSIRLGDGNSSILAWFLRLNPTVTAITSIASRSIFMPFFIIGIIMTIVTVLFGRIFCGAVCPLGSIIDFTDHMLWTKVGIRQTWRPPIKLQGLKYILLFILIVLAIFGLIFPLFMDPMLLVTRIFTLVIRPLLFAILRPIGFINAKTLIDSPMVLQGAYAGTMSTYVLFMIILAGSFFDKRFWCQYICPSGAFLGLLSRYSIFTRRTVSAMCNSCGICTLPCPTRAIQPGEDGAGRNTSLAECTLCGLCTADKESCGSFKLGSVLQKNKIHSVDLNRRHIVASVSAGLLLIPALVHKSPKKKPFVPGPIRPPGAVDEEAFLNRCITCGACISACPENALHPCTISKDGLVNWNTPKLVASIGYCAKECTACSEACPTGALIPITQEQKNETVIGTAYVERSRCRPWRTQYKCTICIDACPYDAIKEKVITNEKGREYTVPIVNIRKCVGCGICENVCPVKHEPAIQVFSHGEERIQVTKIKKKKKIDKS